MSLEQLPRPAHRNNNRNPLRLEQDVTEPPARLDLALLLGLLAGASIVFGLAIWKLAELVGL